MQIYQMKQETMDHFMLTYMFIKLEFPLLRVNMYHMPQLLWQCIRCLKMNLLTFSQRKNLRWIKLLCYLPPVVNSVIKLVNSTSGDVRLKYIDGYINL